MATLTKNEARTYQVADREDYPVVADDTIFEGAAVGENGSGYARPLVAADPFLGFAVSKVDNSGGAAGAKLVNVKASGRVVLPIAGVDVTSNDRAAVYASDDNTFTLVATGNSLIGYVSRFMSAGFAVVEFDTGLVKAALQA